MKHKKHKAEEHYKTHKCYNPWLSRKFLLTVAVLIVSIFAFFYHYMTGMEWVSIVSITLTGWGVVDHLNNRIFPNSNGNGPQIGINVGQTINTVENAIDPIKDTLRDQLRHGQL